jgi:glycosyltransferase involved in cell wall biosynthesis
VLASTYTDFEVIVHNDGSEADIAPVRERFSDPRIRWITHGERLGSQANHFDAYAKARGEFIANLDDDDLWKPELLAALVTPLEQHPDVVVAFVHYSEIDADGNIDWQTTDSNQRYWATLEPGPHESFIKLAALDNFIAMACAAVFRKDAISLSDLDYKAPWDQWTAYLLARSGGVAWYVPEQLASYRVHDASITGAALADTARRTMYVMTAFLEDDALRPWRTEIRRRLARGHQRLASELLRQGKIRDARRHAWHSVAVRPTRRSLAFAAAAILAPRTATRVLNLRRPKPLLEREPQAIRERQATEPPASADARLS